MSNKHVEEAIRTITAAAHGRAIELDAIKDRLKRQQYDAHVERRTAELLQRMRHLCGLEPDPQLESKPNGDKAAA
jgi:hypothetical protein